MRATALFFAPATIFASLLLAIIVSNVNAATVYIDVSLLPASGKSLDCTSRTAACPSFKRASQNYQTGTANNIYLTYTDAPAAVRAYAPTWTRITAANLPASLTAEERDTLLYANAGQIMIDMQWQCFDADVQYMDALEAMISQSSSTSDAAFNVPATLMPDPALQSLKWPTNVDTGLVSDVIAKQSNLTSTGEKVFIRLNFGPACLSYQLQNPSASPQKLVVALATINNLAFQGFTMGSYYSNEVMLGPIQLRKTAGLPGSPSMPTLTLNNVAFLHNEAVVSYRSADNTVLPQVTMNNVAIYNSSKCALCFEGGLADTQITNLLMDRVSGGIGIKSICNSSPNSIDIANSIFRRSKASSLIYADSCPNFNVEGSTLEQNSADLAVFYTKGTSTITSIGGTTFQNNQGVCLSVNDGVVGIEFSNFINNTFKSQGNTLIKNDGGAAIRTTDAEVKIWSPTTFIGNKAPRGGAIYLYGRGSQLQIQKLYPKTAIFSNNVATDSDGGAVYASNTGPIFFRQTVFDGNRATGSGGAVFIDGAQNVEFNGAQINNCTSTVTGGAVGFSLAAGTVQSTTFTGCSTSGNGGSLYLDRSYISFVQSYVSGSQAGANGGFAFVADSSSGIVIANSTIDSAVAPIGAALTLQGGPVVVVDSSTISRSTASIGGGFIALQSHGDGSVKPVVFHSEPDWLKTQYNYDFSLIASQGIDVTDYMHVKFSQVSLVDTIAMDAGDVFLCLGEQCNGWPDQVANGNIEFLPQRKPASSPLKYWSSSDPRTIDMDSFLIRDLVGTNWTNAQKASPSGNYVVRPGQTFSINLQVLDIFGMSFHSYTGFSVKLDATVTYSPPGAQETKLTPAGQSSSFNKDGKVVFENLVISGSPGAQLTLIFSFTSSLKREVTLTVPISVTQCPFGFALISQQCLRCNGPRSYSNRLGATSCSDCPDNAVCDGDSVKSKAGYYLIYKNATSLANASQVPDMNMDVSSFSMELEMDYAFAPLDFIALDTSSASQQVDFIIATCPNTYCLEGNQCSDNRGGLLCGACRPGASEWQGRCVECGSQGGNGGLVFLWILYLLAMFFAQHINSQSPRSGALKILFFFTQSFLMISGPVSSQLLLWARALFQFDLVFTGDSAGANCPFERSSYGKLLTNLFQPVAFVLMLIIMFIPIQVIRGIIILVTRIKNKEKAKSSANKEQEQAPPTTPVSPVTSPVELAEVQSPGSTTSLVIEDAKIVEEPSKPAKAKAQKAFKVVVIKKLRKLFFGTSTWVRSLLTMLVLSYQMLTVAGFGYFNCRTIGPFQVLASATDILCTSGEYFSYRWLFVLACIYAFAFPLFVFILLAILRFHPSGNKLNNRDVRRFLGAFYLQYRSSCNWWMEAFVLSRRLVVVLLIVFLGSYSTAALWPVLLIVLLGFQIVQFVFRPYVHWSENVSEELSLSALMLITALNMSSSLTLNPELATVFSVVALLVFLVTCAVTIISFFSNYWLVVLIKDKILERARQNPKFNKVAKEVSKRRGSFMKFRRESTFNFSKEKIEVAPGTPSQGEPGAESVKKDA